MTHSDIKEACRAKGWRVLIDPWGRRGWIYSRHLGQQISKGTFATESEAWIACYKNNVEGK